MASSSSDVHSSAARQDSSEAQQQQQTPEGTDAGTDAATAPSTDHVGQIVAVDREDDDDADSAIGSTNSASNYSTSLASSLYAYTYENGRRYHAYRAGTYPLPNDDDEQDRLDLAHHIFKLILGGSLYSAPIKGTQEHPRPSPQRILDVATGTGIWAIEMADEFPEATVIGTDLSPIQPGWLPPNCRFYVDDAESEWAFGERDGLFDYIHSRGLAGGIVDWVKLYKQMYRNLIPNGWAELQEYNCNVYCNDEDTAKKAVWCTEWTKNLDEASLKFGKRLDVADYQRGWLEEAGFVDVKDYTVKVPVGGWAKDSKLKEMGRFARPMMLATVEAYTLQLFTRVLGKSLEETHVIIANVRRELSDPTLHLYLVYHFIRGRKPDKA